VHRAAVIVALIVACLAVSSPPAVARSRVPYPPEPSWPDARGCLGIGHPSPRLTGGQMQRIVVHLLATEKGDLEGLSPCPGGPLIVELQPGREWLARRLGATYGSKLEIFIGLTTWHGRPGRSPVCGALSEPTAQPRGLRLSLHLDQTSVVSGSVFHGTVAIKELGPGHFSMDTGQPVQAVVVRAGTQKVVGVYSGLIGGTGYRVNLARGQSKAVPVIGGTARCDGGTGSALPAGTYGVIVQISKEGLGLSPQYLTAEVPLRVLPARR
jgi:hypothetical protein